jgi:hypothetical protein
MKHSGPFLLILLIFTAVLNSACAYQGTHTDDHPECGGWGGRFLPADGNSYRDGDDFAGEDFHARATVYRWRPYFQNEFQVRMDWCVKDVDEVNHPPKAVINGDDTRDVVHIKVKEGEMVSINTIGTFDPDEDSLSYSWWIYPEAGTAQQCPEM